MDFQTEKALETWKVLEIPVLSQGYSQDNKLRNLGNRT